jgi:hypothetical protein
LRDSPYLRRRATGDLRAAVAQAAFRSSRTAPVSHKPRGNGSDNEMNDINPL